MHSTLLSMSTLTAVALFALIGCQRDVGPGVEIDPANVSRVGGAGTCNTLRYSDAVYYYSSSKYIVSPEKSRSGTYTATPKGLAIDPATGNIDVNKSESGVEYQVTFTPKGSGAPCTQSVIISGINYKSQIYNLAAGNTQAVPFYNAQIGATAPCGSAGDCEYNNESDPVIAGLLAAGDIKKKPKGVGLDVNSGVIDLKSAVANGVFGVIPVNGTVVEYRMYYRLNDASKKALNYIDVKLHYYSKASLVPAGLVAQASYKNSATFRVATVTPATPKVSGAMSTAEASAPRPPEIIIVGDY